MIAKRLALAVLLAVVACGQQPQKQAAIGGQSAQPTVAVTPGSGAVVADPGCLANTLPGNDDNYLLVALPSPVNFYGRQFSSAFISNNGRVTFGFASGSWRGWVSPSVGPEIAALFDDVYTGNPSSTPVTYGSAVFEGRPAYCVNWVNVNPCCSWFSNSHNSFQLLLVDRSDVAVGDFDIVMNYDSIQWHYGGGAGYSAGDGVRSHFFEMPGSGGYGAFLDSNPATSLAKTSHNSPILGRHVFPIRNGGLNATGLAPLRGLSSGGTAVTISGQGFASGATVTVGGVAATNVAVSGPTSIAFVTPPGTPGVKDVVVTNSDGFIAVLGGAFTYEWPLAVSSVVPSSGPGSGGSTVTLTGTGFAAGTTVTVGGASASNLVVSSATAMTFRTPAGAPGARDVVVTSPAGQVATVAGGFTYVAPPSIGSVVPSSGAQAGGTTVTVTGSNFTPGSTVKVGGVAATSVVVNSPTSMTFSTPPGTPGARDVTVTNPDGQTVTQVGGFTYMGPPALETVSPSSGPQPGGTSVTITGSGFAAGATVHVGGVAATGVVVNGATSLNFTTPPGAPGLADVVVTNPDGQSATLAGGFAFVAPPALAGISPSRGPSAGGTSVTATGSGFASGATVRVGGAAARNAVVNSSTSLTFTTPAGPPGVADVVVSNVDGQAGTLGGSFTYVAPPAITSVSPPRGPAAGGTLVTLAGSGFSTGATVTLGGVTVPGALVGSATSITFTTPPGSPGAVNVMVTNPDGQSATSSGGFTFMPPSTISSILPSSGPAAGGTAVTLTGSGFISGATVTVGGTAATNVVVSSGASMFFTTPAGTPGARDVVVTNPDGQSTTVVGGFTYLAPPVVAGVSPASGRYTGGTSVTLTGSGLTAGATVTVGGAAATGVVVASGTSMTFTTPPGTPGARDVVVTNPDGQAATLTGGFTYVPPPAVASVTPSSGPSSGGTSVTLTGSGFAAGATVTVGGASASSVDVSSATSMTFTTPAGSPGARDVVVTNADGQMTTRTGGFTYVAPPAIASVTPPSGPGAGGTSVTLTGSGFLPGATVAVRGTAATGVTVASEARLTFVAPAGAPGAADVVVTNPDGQAGALLGGFTWLAPPPAIVGVEPSEGRKSGGTAVTLTGASFQAGATVTVGGSPASNVVVVDGATITFTTPSGSLGAKDVMVSNPDGQDAILAKAFNYRALSVTGWALTGSMAEARTLSSLTALPSQKTLVAGGYDYGTRASLAGAEIYDPETEQWASTGPMTVARAGHIAVLLPDGKVLVAGGVDAGGNLDAYLYSAELYDPATGSWTQTGPMNEKRTNHTATLLPSGKVLVVGGASPSFSSLASAEIYDPQSGTWTVTGTMTQARQLHAATLLASGKVLVTGAWDYDNLISVASAEMYDPASGAWQPAGLMSSPRYGHTATLLADGKVLVTGGATNDAVSLITATAEEYDPATSTWRSAGSMEVPRNTHVATLLATGKVLIAGGNRGSQDLKGAELYDVNSGQWTHTLSMNVAREQASAVRLNSGQVLVVGGDSLFRSFNSAELYDLIAVDLAIASVSPSSGPASGGTHVTLIGSNFVAGATVMVGGTAASNVTVVNATTITFTTPPGSPGARDVMVVNPDGQIVVSVGGFTYVAPPSIAFLWPSSGPATGGTLVAMSGAGFTTGATVAVGGVLATDVAVVDSMAITFTSPPSQPFAMGPQDVVVTNPDGQSATLFGAFTYVPPPQIFALWPSSGSRLGGTYVQASVMDAQWGVTVTVAGVPALNVGYSWNGFSMPATVSFTTPPGTVGPADVVITNPDGQSGTAVAGFTYVPSPVVVSVWPSTGPTAGGTAVTLHGVDLSSGASITVGGAPATNVVFVNDTTITFTTPSGTAGARDVTLSSASGEAFVAYGAFTYLAPGTSDWALAGPMKSARSGHSATVLKSGKVLVVGGGPTALSEEAETWDPADGLWNYTGATTVARMYHTATLLPSGKVLVTGGHEAGASLASAELYDPATNSWSATGTMATARSLHTATLLPSGKVLVVGGYDLTTRATIGSAELWDPVSGTWAAAGAVTARNSHGASLLPSGKVVVFGGWGPLGNLSSAEVYDPAANSWTTTGSLTAPRSGMAAMLLGGRVLAAGGSVGGSGSATTSASSEVYDPAAQSWSSTGTMATARTAHAAVELASGKALVTGGLDGRLVELSGVETYDPGSGSWTVLKPLRETRFDHKAVRLSSGKVLVIGGRSAGPAVASTEIYETLALPPDILSLSPAMGARAGGTTVTMTGSGFQPGAGVSIGGAPASNVVVVSDTTITFSAPPGALGPADVVVTNPDGQSKVAAGAFLYVEAPVVSAMSPTSGPLAGGTSVSLSGAGFQPGATVTVGGMPSPSVIVMNSTWIIFTTPPGMAGPQTVVVTNPDGQSASAPGTFTYSPAPFVASVSPASGPRTGGTAVTISGTGFVSGATVLVGGATATGAIVVSSTTITFTTPAAWWAGPQDVVVTNPDGQTASVPGGFTYLAAPEIYSLSPSSGPLAGGTMVTVNGMDIASGATVSVGGVWAGFLMVGWGPITFMTPPGVAGPQDVVITNPDGMSATLVGGFTYLGAPVIAAVEPSSGPRTGDTSVTITGTDFSPGATVTFGGTYASCSPNRPTTTSIGCITPAGPRGAVDVVVTNEDGLSGTLTGGFTYLPAPAIEVVWPSSGPVGGGTTVTLRGVDLAGGGAVTVGGATASNVVFVNATTMTFTVPPGSPGRRDVVLTIPGYAPAVATGGFTYLQEGIPDWAATGSMRTPRYAHTATLLPSGKVLVEGGIVATDAPAELWDPATGTWSATAIPLHWRTEHTATLLTSGKVLTVGARRQGIGSTAELYDPATETWVATGSLASGRYNHTATLLPDGKVLVAGGNDDFTGAPRSSAELYDPATGEWSSTGSMSVPRGSHAAILMTNGKVLVAGGSQASGAHASAEVYDPAKGTWTATGTMATARGNLRTATLLPSGKVLVVGGDFGTAGYSAELYDPTLGSWSLAGSVVEPRSLHTSTLLPSGRVLIAGGTITASMEVYDAASGAWSVAAPMAKARGWHTATLLASGKVLIIGGYDGSRPMNDVEILETLGRAPLFWAITPWKGASAGGTVVTLTGDWFQPGATVTVGGALATNVTVPDSSTLIFTTPAGVPGARDVVVTNPDGQSYTAANAFTYNGTVAPSDLDGDGKSDLLWQGGTDVYAWFLNGGSYTYAYFGAPPAPWRVIGTGDFDGDGVADVLWRNGTDMYIWFMHGGSPYAYAYVAAPPEPWQVEGVGDFDGDGKADLFWRNGTDGYLWFMNGGAFTWAYVAAPPAQWTIAGVGDFDGDGRSDLMWRNETDVYVWFLNGGNFTWAYFASPPSPWSVAGVGDFDADGKSDVLWKSGMDMYIWYMHGQSAVTADYVMGLGAPWYVAQVGDFDGDGRSDLMWRNGSELQGWYMNGLDHTTGTFYGPPIPWEVVSGVRVPP